MKIAMISGSPKVSGSASMYLLSQLEPLLQGCEITIVTADEVMWQKDETERKKCIREMLRRDAVVLSFPLYFDAIPSNMLLFMREAEQIMNEIPHEVSMELDENGDITVHRTVLHVIVNNGFYEASQNKTAIDMAHIWGNKCGFERGSGIAVGAGGMVQMAPMGKGPMHNLGAAMNEFASDIRSYGSGKKACVRSQQVILVEPNFPRFLYIKCAHIGWHQLAKKNGLRVKDIEGIIKDKNVMVRQGGGK